MKFVFLTDFFESSALALWMKKIEGCDVKVLIRDHDYKKILNGILDKEPDVFPYLGEGNLFIFDDASSGKSADRLRDRKEKVFGGSETSDRMENERAFGQSVMKKFGIDTVQSFNFKGMNAANEAIEFLKKKRGKWVIKQNGEADKSLSTVGKFENSEDAIDKLNDIKKIWVEDVDFDLQEFVDGHECAVEGWFNGKDWVKDKSGEPVFICNWEHKKKSDGDTGRTTGETATLAYRTRKGSMINKELFKLTDHLRQIKYVGNIDVNFILSKDGKRLIGLEFTNRFGYPMLNLQMEMFKSKWSDLLLACATGNNDFKLEIDPRWAVVVVVQVPPFPFSSVKDRDNAKGQRIYFLEDGKMIDGDLKQKQLRHVHLYEVKYEKETKHYLCSGDTGYLLTVTAQADTVKQANDKALNYIRQNVYTSNMDYRKDAGINERVTSCIKFMEERKYL